MILNINRQDTIVLTEMIPTTTARHCNKEVTRLVQIS